jgi:hypothetical protein
MEQLTLEQAAGNHARRSCVTHVELSRSAEEIANIGFQAGAAWQKEQYKRLIELIKEGCPVLLCEGFDDLVEQINNELSNIKS